MAKTTGGVAEAPALATSPDEMAALRAEVERLKARGVMGDEFAAMVALLAGEQARLLKQDVEQQTKLKAAQAECQKSTLARTQEAADRLFQGPRRYKVGLPKDKAQPVIEVNAHSPEEAEGRYRSLCGIRATDHEIVAGEPGAAPLQPAPSANFGAMSLAQLHGGDE